MKSFAIISLAVAALAAPNPSPDHVVTALVTCKDAAVAKETVTVTAPCKGNGGNGGYTGHGGDKGQGGNAPAPVTVTVTATVTKTKVNGGGYTMAPPPDAAEGGNEEDDDAEGDKPEGDKPEGDKPEGDKPAATFTVAVGAFPQGTGLPPLFEFRPNNIKAKKGDVVKFQMLGKKHSVTQSNFAKPCVNINKFDTGLIANPENATDIFRDWVVPDDTKPLWAYCKNKETVNHCGTGMVFGINPKSQEQMDEFIALAKEQNGTAAAPAPAAAAAEPPIDNADTPSPRSVGGFVARMW